MSVVPYLAGAVTAGVAGGVLATLWAPGRWVTSYIQHFAAGVVIAAVALKVAPDIEHTGAPPDINETEELRWIPLSEVERRIAAREIVGAGSVAGLLAVLLARATGRL